MLACKFFTLLCLNRLINFCSWLSGTSDAHGIILIFHYSKAHLLRLELNPNLERSWILL